MFISLCLLFSQLPHEDERNGVITGYEVEYRITQDDPDEPYLIVSVSPDNSSDTTTLVLEELGGGRSYDIRVTAFTEVGPGPPSEIVTAVTLRGITHHVFYLSDVGCSS